MEILMEVKDFLAVYLIVFETEETPASQSMAKHVFGLPFSYSLWLGKIH